MQKIKAYYFTVITEATTEHLLVLSNFIVFKSLIQHNRIHQLLVYADNVNLLGKHINIVEENTEALLVGSKATGLEVNAE
jgi:hypothetical protein